MRDGANAAPNVVQTRGDGCGDGAHLGSNCRHLGDLKRLSRFSRLDAQFAGRRRRLESLPYGLRDVALGCVVALKRGVDVRLAGTLKIAVVGAVSLSRLHPCPTNIWSNKDHDAAIITCGQCDAFTLRGRKAPCRVTHDAALVLSMAFPFLVCSTGGITLLTIDSRLLEHQLQWRLELTIQTGSSHGYHSQCKL